MNTLRDFLANILRESYKTFKLLSRNWIGLFGFLTTLAIVLISFFGPIVWPPETSANVADINKGISSTHWLGADFQGQDNLRKVVNGGREIVTVAFLTGVIATLIAVVVGSFSAFVGGGVDSLLMELVNIWLTIPKFPLLAVLATVIKLDTITLSLLIPVTSASAAMSATDFRNAMRKLWEDHITWTRLYIISVAADLPDKDQTAQRLLQNQVDIGNAVKPFYGDQAGDQLAALLRDHILGAADLLAAAKAGDKAKIDAASAKWYANADDIAAFLSGANPKAWPLAGMQAGMKMHLDLTLKEAVDRLSGKYADDIKDYDQVHAHILGLADLLSSGILAQFPDKFDQTTANEFTLRSTMRKLWEDHITWTRLYIVSAAANLPDKELTAQRLLQNQTDIGNAIKPFYGDAAGDKLTSLLKDHILIAAEIIQDAKAGDTTAMNDAIARWYANADDIAVFLHNANPDNWPLEDIKAMMHEHLDLTLQEAVAYLHGDYSGSVAAYDQVHLEILDMADMLSDGIIQQFPKRFK